MGRGEACATAAPRLHRRHQELHRWPASAKLRPGGQCGVRLGAGSTMPDDTTSSPRYSAFISYSSVDAKFAAWLHRELESYRLPRRLSQAGRARLKPLFHDTWELNAHHDLPQALREAIAGSESLIVICSPAARRSEWVGREIELFRSLHGD